VTSEDARITSATPPSPETAGTPPTTTAGARRHRPQLPAGEPRHRRSGPSTAT
jgi:hypothetical protein